MKKCQQNVQKLKTFSLKIHKGAEIFKTKTKTFLNKSTQHKKNSIKTPIFQN